MKKCTPGEKLHAVKLNFVGEQVERDKFCDTYSCIVNYLGFGFQGLLGQGGGWRDDVVVRG